MTGTCADLSYATPAEAGTDPELELVHADVLAPLGISEVSVWRCTRPAVVICGCGEPVCTVHDIWHGDHCKSIKSDVYAVVTDGVHPITQQEAA